MSTVIERVQALRAAIRYHRDQKGDDRCWLDDDQLWALLPDAPAKPAALPPFDEMMRRCAAFYRFRRADMPDVVPTEAIQDSSQWDADLISMDGTALETELARLHEAVRMHRDIQNRERTLEDDRELYRILPEQLPADFRLPAEEDFLGEARAPKAGCPSFWRSHQSCPCEQHNLHAWGPCIPYVS